MIKKPVIFLDRDGVINRKMPEGDYVKDWSEFFFLPGVFRAIRMLKGNGFLIAVITNQRCVATGIITEEGLKKIHERMLDEIRKCGGDIDAIYFCPHDISDGCGCRKPEPGMILRAIEDFKDHNIEIDLERSYIIGDSEKDMASAKALDIKSIKIGGYSPEADINKKDLLEAVESIIEVIEEAIVLVGGLGTRLRSVVKDLPKPLADVGGKPFLWHLVNKLLKEGIKRVILSAGYKAELISEFVREFFHNENIDVVVEREPLGTGGAVRLSMSNLLGNYFFLLNGDSFFDIDLRKFERHSFSIGNFDVSMALCEMENPDRFGIVEIDKRFMVTRFRAKSSGSGIISSPEKQGMEIKDKIYINGGIYILRKSVLESYLRNFPDRFSFEEDVLERLNLCVIGIPYKENFIDIGLPEDYMKTFDSDNPLGERFS